ncbi:MAG: cadmium-translocating P-type ATPase [Planctomycetales bacterium]|nr:cadmium-translocating P-type ATPase [Planctomycetales bacterium]
MSWTWWTQKQNSIAVLATLAIVLHLALWIAKQSTWVVELPLWLALFFGGIPLVWELIQKFLRREFGSDLLAGIAIVASVILGEYLAGTFVVLMLSGGEALEAYALRSASRVLEALANRMPSVAHRKLDGEIKDTSLFEIRIGDLLVVYPHELCPVDGTVVEGHGVMDESYLTGEPYHISKTPGSQVLSGAINGETALVVEASKLPADSRYAKIMQVMQESQANRPQIRRLGDQLGAYYTPLAVCIGLAAWAVSLDPTRFLAVVVVATPCPLLIAIPVAIIGSISLAARRAIVIRDPAVLEQASTCSTFIFDKTGTLTYGEPELVEQLVAPEIDQAKILQMAASLEQYSKHPLSHAILTAAQNSNIPLLEVKKISERPGEGLVGIIGDNIVRITSRNKLNDGQKLSLNLPQISSGLECVVVLNDTWAAVYRFRDRPRADGHPFIQHLGPKHKINRLVLLSGDRAQEVQYLADLVGVKEVYAEKSPEEKLAIVRQEVGQARVLYLGDGINDAPAMLASTVGLAMGQNSDVIAEAAGAVIMDSSLQKVDEFLHIGERMRSIALQSAIGGIAFSILGMCFAAAGTLPPVAGAIIQELIDILAVTNALRAAFLPKYLTDY